MANIDTSIADGGPGAQSGQPGLIVSFYDPNRAAHVIEHALKGLLA
jgi:hypothetical protein